MLNSGSIISLIILTSLILEFILNLTAGFLNLKCMSTTIPDEFNDVIDRKGYARAQEYLRQNTKLGFIESLIDLSVLLIFWASGGFSFLDVLVRGWGLGTVETGLTYIGLLVVLKGLVTLPLGIYSTFVIEQKFGFNTTTPLLFITDLIKSLVVACLLAGPLLASVLWFLENAGEGAWLVCWLVSAVFIMAVQTVVPTWILPLFNTFTPMESGKLKDAITRYADSIAFPLSAIFIMDGSKRSTKSNAFFTGFGKNRRIVLFDTLVQRHATEELVAILAHEMGHFKKKHIVKRMIYSSVHMGALFYLISVCISYPGLFEAFSMEYQSIYAGLVFFGMLYSPIELVLSVTFQAVSRHDEYEADRFAVATTPDRNQLVTALKKLSADNLSNFTPHPMEVFLHYSHPPVQERIRAIRSA